MGLSDVLFEVNEQIIPYLNDERYKDVKEDLVRCVMELGVLQTRLDNPDFPSRQEVIGELMMAASEEKDDPAFTKMYASALLAIACRQQVAVDGLPVDFDNTLDRLESVARDVRAAALANIEGMLAEAE